MMDKLHRQMVKQPLEPQTADYNSILHAISAWTSPQHARTIADSLVKYFNDSGARATALRISVLFSFRNDDRMWPVVEWKEENGSELLALFHFDNPHRHGVCSWLVHYGMGRLGNEGGWRQTSLAWGVSDMSHLKTLFGAAQHFIGILKWDSALGEKLYCATELFGYTEEEYIPVESSNDSTDSLIMQVN